MKTCKHPDCAYPVFSNSYCKQHQQDRTDEKWIQSLNKPSQRTMITKVSKKQADKIKSLKTNDTAFYMDIWNESEHVCDICGVFLGHEPSMMNFHHCFPKAKYPQLRYDPANIIILCDQCHIDAHANNEPEWYTKLKQDRKHYFNL